MKNLITILTLACLMLSSVPVIAQPKTVVTDMSDAETLAKVAHERFQTKDFASSASLYLQAFAKSKNLTTLFNAGRSYEEAGNKTEAIATFKLYITLATDAEAVLNAKERIAKLEAKPSSVVVQSPVVVRQATPVATPVVKQQGFVQPNSDHTAAWMTSGGAVVALGTGVALLVVGAAGTQPKAYTSRAQYDSARGGWISGAVLTGVGVALAGVSSYLWLSPPKVAIAPTANGITIGGVF